MGECLGLMGELTTLQVKLMLLFAIITTNQHQPRGYIHSYTISLSS